MLEIECASHESADSRSLVSTIAEKGLVVPRGNGHFLAVVVKAIDGTALNRTSGDDIKRVALLRPCPYPIFKI